jgi:large subunit ribosomal protein L23
MELRIHPRISEKTFAQAQAGIYVFDVPTRATKQQISDAVAKQFAVEVVTINTVLAKGKVKKSYRKGGSPVVGKRNDVKKAYVRLAEGQSIPVFNTEDTATPVKAEEKK